MAALRARLQRLNPIALTRDVVQGEIDPDWLFNIAAPGAARARDFSGLVEQVDGRMAMTMRMITTITTDRMPASARSR